ncbi:MAG: transcriptional regulator [Candidatus Aenigmarchaeota archaeon]|nr:transcriptional regulator [Candidatus Aenigmarchaeota archaeon]
MQPFCEYMVREIFPSLRAMIAKDLIADYGMSQGEAASLIGITQPAVSQYMRSLRGRGILQEEPVRQAIKEISRALHAKVIGKDDLPAKFCEICNMLSKNPISFSAIRQ